MLIYNEAMAFTNYFTQRDNIWQTDRNNHRVLYENDNGFSLADIDLLTSVFPNPHAKHPMACNVW